MATSKSEESNLTTTNSRESVVENTYGFMTAVKASILLKTFPFNYVNTGFLKIIGYWISINLITIAPNLATSYLFTDNDRFKKMDILFESIVPISLFILLLSALLLGKTSRNIKKPTYVQILTLIFISLTYLPMLTFFYFFVRKASTYIISTYVSVSALISFAFIVKNLNAIWKFTHHKFFFVVFYFILFCILSGYSRIFFEVMHGTDSDIENLFKFPSFEF